MLGIDDFWIWLPYLLCIFSALLCVIYGAVNWNKDGEEEALSQEDVEWAKEQDKLEEEL